MSVAMNLYRTSARGISSPSTGKWLLQSVIVLQSSLYSTRTTNQKYSRKPKQEPLSFDTELPGFPTASKLTHKEVPDWPRPSEIPWQAKVANSVNLIGSVRMPVQFQASPDGKYWAGTIISQEKSADFPPLWIPVIFEGDLAHIAACHLKENDLVYIGGQISADPPPFPIEHGQANVQVMVQSMNFVQNSYQKKKSYAPHNQDEWAFHFSAKVKDDDSVNQSWNELLAKPHEWWDNRLKENNPTDAAFEHKDNGRFLWIDDSTPEWVQLKLESLTFDYKTKPKSQKRASMMKDGESVESSWRDLVRNPKQWRDHRKDKLNGLVNPRYPDFKHNDSGKSLWSSSAPKWALPILEGLEFDVQSPKMKQVKDDKGEGLKFGVQSPKSTQVKDNKGEGLWKNLVENPDRWWDNRSDKFNKKAPDFKHKDTGEGLWLDRSPAWVLPKLPPAKPKKDGAFGKRDTLLS